MIQNYVYCTNDNFTLDGGFESNIYNYFKLKIKRCIGNTCASLNEVNKFYQNMNLEIFIKKTNFLET